MLKEKESFVRNEKQSYSIYTCLILYFRKNSKPLIIKIRKLFNSFLKFSFINNNRLQYIKRINLPNLHYFNYL